MELFLQLPEVVKMSIIFIGLFLVFFIGIYLISKDRRKALMEKLKNKNNEIKTKLKNFKNRE